MADLDGVKERLQAELLDLQSQTAKSREIAQGIDAEISRNRERLNAATAAAETFLHTIPSVIASASQNTSALSAMQAQAISIVAQIEEMRRRADSESGFAFNAKVNAEEHAKIISKLSGTAEAAVSGLAAAKQQAEEASLSLTALKNLGEAQIKELAEARSTSVREAALITAAAERVNAIMPSVDAGARDANAISATKTNSDAASVAVAALQQQMIDIVTKASADTSIISKSRTEAGDLVSLMAEASTSARGANERVIAYQTELVDMRDAYGSTQLKLEGLLPHATSAGLASAFHSQKIRFSRPRPYWLGLFVIGIICLLAAASWGIPAANDSWDAILRHFVNRLPIVAPLVWLAIYAGHQYNMTLRMEEDYAFKEAVSTAFEGYKREMLNIPVSDAAAVSPLVILCENVLSALAERPGRIYDGKVEVVTPMTPLFSAVKDAVSEITKFKDVLASKSAEVKPPGA